MPPLRPSVPKPDDPAFPVYLRLRISRAQRDFLESEATRLSRTASEIVRLAIDGLAGERARQVNKATRKLSGALPKADPRQVPMPFEGAGVSPLTAAPPAASDEASE